jgi:hypothetical protein
MFFHRDAGGSERGAVEIGNYELGKQGNRKGTKEEELINLEAMKPGTKIMN